MAEDKSFFVGQKAFIERDGKILVLFDPKGRVDFPGGKIQEGEMDFIASLLREVAEETGLAVTVGDPFAVWSFDLPPGHKNEGKTVLLIGYRCGYMGGEPHLSDEHSRSMWVGKEDVTKMKGAGGHMKALKGYFSIQ